MQGPTHPDLFAAGASIPNEGSGPAQTERRGLRSMIRSRRTVEVIFEGPYWPNVRKLEAAIAGMKVVDVTCVFRCCSLAPPHKRTKRWRRLSGPEAIDLGRHMLSWFLAGDPRESTAPVTACHYRITRRRRSWQVIEFHYRLGGKRRGSRPQDGVLVRFEQR